MRFIKQLIIFILLISVKNLHAIDLQSEHNSKQNNKQNELENAKKFIENIDFSLNCTNMEGIQFIFKDDQTYIGTGFQILFKDDQLYISTLNFDAITKGDLNLLVEAGINSDNIEKYRLTNLNAKHDKSNNSYLWTLRSNFENVHRNSTYQLYMVDKDKLSSRLYMDKYKLFIKREGFGNYVDGITTAECSYNKITITPSIIKNKDVPVNKEVLVNEEAIRKIKEANAVQQSSKKEKENNYATKIRACIQPGVSFPSNSRGTGPNPTTQYRVSLKDNGTISGVALMQSSGNTRFDQAVAIGINRCNPFPRPATGAYPDSIDISYNMYEETTTATPSTTNTPRQNSNSDVSLKDAMRNDVLGNATKNVMNTPSTQATSQTLTYPHGIYVGEVKNGKANGIGTYTSKQSGTVYSGQFVADTFSGIGTMTWTNGSKYVGEWSNDSGIKGIMTYSDGRTAIGTVENAIFRTSQ